MNRTPVNESKGTILYFSHGGGPLPILGEPSHQAMVTFMEQLAGNMRIPELILVISAHWEEKQATVIGAPAPTMLYDYYGFPEEAYRITYPAPGAPEPAAQIVDLLAGRGMNCRMDTKRGFDHGLFIPLKLMYPAADIPAIQLSLVQGLVPDVHLKMGQTLQPLLQHNILVIGSGFSFHNMQEFSWDGSNPKDTANNLFQDWLVETCTTPLSSGERRERLVHWTQAPSARYCHPREEHLLPLHVCAGIAGDSRRATTIFDDYILGKRAVAFQWQ